MTGMEAAIRGALEKAGIPGAQARRKIYDSARGALDRSLERQGIADQAQIDEHRRKLEVLIAGIEAEWTPAGEMTAQDVTAAQAPVAPVAIQPVSPVSRDTGSTRAAPKGDLLSSWPEPVWPEGSQPEVAPKDPSPSLDSPRRDPATSAAPPVSATSLSQRPAAASVGEANLDFAPDAGLHMTATPAAADRGLSAERPPHVPAPTVGEARAQRSAKKVKAPKQPKPKRRRGAFASMFSAAVMLSFLGIGVWWLIDSGVLMTAEERNTGVPNPPPSLSRDDFSGGPQSLNPGSGFSGEWSNVYTPGRDGAAQARGNASAELIEQEGGNVLRITSRSADANGEVLIPLGAEVMQALAGRKSVLALTVRTDSADTTQIYVKCEFSVLGECGRHRFDVTYDTQDILFNLDYDRALAPNEGGNLVINSDIAGTGKAIDLVAVRIRPLS